MTLFIRATRTAALFAAFAASPGTAGADPAPGPVGYLDATGGFHALARTGDVTTPAAVATYNGAIYLTLTVRVSSDSAHVPRSSAVRCKLFATVSTVTGPGPQFDTITETGQVSAPIVASSATCRIVIPYSWELVAGPYDAISMNFTVTAQDSAGVGRTRDYRLQPIKVPRDQTNTVITKSVRL